MPDKRLDDLLRDIRTLFKQSGRGALLDPKNFTKFGADAATQALMGIHREEKIRPENTVYASELGTVCLRQFWYKLNAPNLAEPFSPSAKLKFLYGNLIEQLVLLLAKEAGHVVSYEQESIETTTSNGTTIRGRIDAVIDGEIVDVKSASPAAFLKMADKKEWLDPFGYAPQLNFYVQNGARVYAKKGRFLLVNKVSGELAFSYAVEQVPDGLLKKAEILASVKNNKLTALGRITPARHPKGQILKTICAYCPYKRDCWSHSNKGKGLDARRYAKEVLFFVEVTDKGTPGFEARKIELQENEKIAADVLNKEFGSV